MVAYPYPTALFIKRRGATVFELAAMHIAYTSGSIRCYRTHVWYRAFGVLAETMQLKHIDLTALM